MAMRAVACDANQGLALFIYSKREEFLQKDKVSENLDATLRIAYKNVCDHKAPICSLRDAGQVRGIGAWMLGQIKDFFEGDAPKTQKEPAQSPSGRAKKRKYLPQKNSAAYALLITLHRSTSGDKEFMLKQELIDAAELSGLARMPIQPSKGSSASGRFGDSTKDWYSGWSCMKTLVRKGLVVKSSCPAKYMLTEEGKVTAEECIVKGGLANDKVSVTAPVIAVADDERPEKRVKKESARKAIDPSGKSKTCIDSAEEKSNRFIPTRPIAPATSLQSTDLGCSGFSNANDLAVPPLGAKELFSNVYEVVLVLDDREHFTRSSKGINSKPMFAQRLCEQYNVEVEIRHLPVGDAVWIARHKYQAQEYVLDFIVERKAVDDLWTSIRDTRYKVQKLRLLRCGIKRLIYLIEGDPNLTEAAESLKTAALTTEILEGFDVQRTRDVHDTINRYGELTNAISRRYASETACSTARLVCMTYNQFVSHCSDVEKERVTDVFGVQLMQVKQVTEDIAMSILEKYPTMMSLVQAYLSKEGDVQSQINLLTGLPILNRNKCISSAISRHVYNFVWAS